MKVYEASAGSAIDVETLLQRVEGSEQRGATFWEEAAHLLQRYAANALEVRRHIDRMGGLEQARPTFVPPQSFILGQTKNFGVRANIWPKMQPTNFRQHEEALYAYDLGHNHDFEFLTVGYYGPGYRTDVFEVDPEDTLRAPNSAIALRRHQDLQLTEGRVFHFEPFKDIHTQHPPESLSISLNLLSFRTPKTYEQCLFDIETSTLIGTAGEGATGRQVATIEFAAAFANEETKNNLSRLMESGRTEKIRSAATSSLQNLDQMHSHMIAV